MPVSLPAHVCLVHLVARYWTSDFGRFDAWRGRLVPAPPAPRVQLDPVSYAPSQGLRATPGRAVPKKEHLQSSGGEAVNPIDPRRMALWMGYLERRGIKFEVGTPVAELKLYDTGAWGLYAQHTRTVYLRQPPNTATFFEEVLHALQHLHNHPDEKHMPNGDIIDAWEYDAKQAVLRHAEKLGLTYEEYIQVEQELQRVIDGTYPS